MPSVFFYVSGHGFGHASREIEVINALSAAGFPPGWEVVVRTSAQRWLFDRTVRRPFVFVEGPCDTGVVQIDSLTLDENETIRRAAEFHRRMPEHAAGEAELLRRHDARLVIADAPPLACAAAHAAGVPSVVLANFTWDWIYEGYPEQLASAPDLIPSIRSAYSHAAAAWRLPMHGGFAGFDRLLDVPFIARRAARPRADVRRRLELPLDRDLALSSFGGYGVRALDPYRLDCLDRWGVVITGHQAPASLPAGVRFIDERELYVSGLRYEDLVGSIDAVVTKPGFGIIAECLANGVPMLYTSRGRFVEYDVLVAQMPSILQCDFIDQESLLAGRWRGPLERLRQAPAPSERPRTDGAGIVAAKIVEWVA